MPEQKMTYQERVLFEASKHAEADNDILRLKNFISAENCLHYGKITVAAQGEAIREALRRWGVREEDIQNELLEHGYIEPKTVTSTGNVVSSETQQESARINDSCVFCGASPFVWKGTCCASCGRSYRHG